MTYQVMMNQIIQVNDKNHGKQHDHEINEDLCQKLPCHWPVMKTFRMNLECVLRRRSLFERLFSDLYFNIGLASRLAMQILQTLNRARND